jgi:amino acid adenylation domain-containing protein
MKRIAESRFQLSPTKRALWQAMLAKDGMKHKRTEKISRAQPTDLVPASFAQQRLWFLDEMDPGQAVYILPNSIRLKGALDIRALENSLTEIVRRHDSLRTTFLAVGGEPVQVIAAPQPISLPVTELSHLNAVEREAEAQRLTSAAARQPFNLSVGPLLRAGLLRLAKEEHVFFLALHHIIADGWSMGLLFKELSILYQAHVRGAELPLEDLALQYTDYALWQRQWLRGEVLEEQLSYWNEQLKDAPRGLELPTDKPRPAVQAYRGASETFSLSTELSQDLKALSRRAGATLFMTLLASFQILLSRYGGQEDVVVGTPSAGREREETHPLIGLFVNTLALRTKVLDTFSFNDLLHSVKEVVLAAHANQDLPFEKLIEHLEPERSLSYHPLFQVMFQLHNAARETLNLEGLECSGFSRDAAGGANFDLVLSMSETEPALSGTIHYNTGLFERGTVARVIEHYRSLLEGIVVNAHQPISQLSLSSAAEQQQVLLAWNDTAGDYPRDKCIHELFEAQVERTPEATALSYDNERLSYRELNERANQLAHYLSAAGVGSEVLVGLCLERSVEMVVAVLGVLKAGGVYVPLDPAYPQERLAFMLADSRITVLLTEESLLTRLPAQSQALAICLEHGGGQCANRSTANPVNRAHSENLAYVIYTSGSTGRPKGVGVAHRCLCNLSVAQSQHCGVQASDRVLQFASLSFDASIFEIVMALCSGAALCLPDRHSLPVGSALVELLRKEQITIALLPPSVVMSMEGGVPQLQTLLVGGEACPADLVERWSDGRTLFNAYGPTEATVWGTLANCKPGSGKPSIGKPVLNARIYVLDHRQRPVPIGVCGEIYIGGAGVARGYLNQFELTAERFVPDPWSSEAGQRLYRTGDLARWSQTGELEYLGRRDQQVKVRGYRIELGEVEAVLARHASVREAVVVTESANGDNRLIAYFVSDEPETTTAELREWLGSQLPDFMVPALFVRLDELPLTTNGKINRRALPLPNRDEVREGYIPPRNICEQTLVDIWGDLLGVQQVSINDNFFALGGHSLLAARLATRIRDAFAAQLPLRTIFEAPTIALQALKLDQIKETPAEFPGAITKRPRETAEVDQLLEQLAHLSEEEVKNMLACELQH